MPQNGAEDKRTERDEETQYLIDPAHDTSSPVFHKRLLKKDDEGNTLKELDAIVFTLSSPPGFIGTSYGFVSFSLY